MATGVETGSDIMDQVLLCQVCLNPFTNRKPRQLSCLHSFCEPCLNNISRNTSGNNVICSTCRQTTELPGGLVANLPLNFNIEKTHQMVKKMARARFCTKCCNKNEFVLAKTKCITCNWLMCDPCKSQHDQFPGFSLHHVESVTAKQTKNQMQNCGSHKKPITLYCTTCKQVLCTDCLLESNHDSHPDNIKNIENACEENRELVSAKKAVLTSALDFLKTSSQENIEINKHFDRVKSDIDKFADSLRLQISEQEDKILSTLEHKHMAISEKRRVNIEEALRTISSHLTKLEDFEKKESLVFLEKSESWILNVSEFEEIIKRLKEEGDIPKVTFTKLLQIPSIGKFDKMEHFPLASVDSDLLTRNELDRESSNRMGKILAEPKPTLVQKHIDLPIDHGYIKFATMNDGTAVFVNKSRNGLLRINIEGEILSRYQHDEEIRITSVSAFGDRVVFIGEETDIVQELAVDGQRMVRVKTHKKQGIKTDCVHLDNGGNLLLYDHELVTKLDHRCNIIWQKIIAERCTISSGMINKKQCYLAISKMPDVAEIWNENGHVIGTLQYPSFDKNFSAKEASITSRGSFMVTHKLVAVYDHITTPDDYFTVSEYTPNGSFVGHLLATADGIGSLGFASCDQQGYMWLTDLRDLPRLNIYKL